jgi:hypothetical protein
MSPAQLSSSRTRHAEQTSTEQQHRAGLWDGVDGVYGARIVQAKGSTPLLVNRELDIVNAILQIWSQL